MLRSVFLGSVALAGLASGSACDGITDPVSCVSHLSSFLHVCVYCAQDKSCHDVGSLYDPCSNDCCASQSRVSQCNHQLPSDIPASCYPQAQHMEAFRAWMKKYNKEYATQEEHDRRFGVFMNNLLRAEKLNEEHILVSGSPVHGVTQFMDLSAEEFKAMYLNYVPRESNVTREVPVLQGRIASDVDWRTQGAVTPVKDQGQCGSCWAFGATAAIESYGKITGTYGLQVLAPQQITSCDKTSYGCQGGWAEHAFNYVQSAGGIELESAYPYVSGKTGQSGTCKADSTKFVAKISGYTAVAAGEANLATALNSGPPTVCLAATAFQTYTGGILSACDNNVDHCVQAVGYTADYWIVRNSWGTGWGEAGYIRIARGKDLCKIADDVTFPKF